MSGQPPAREGSRLSLGPALTRIGERLHVDWLTENPLTFRYIHRFAVANAPGVINTFEEVFPQARSYVDIGAGTAAYAAEAQRRGHVVGACEYSPVARLYAKAQRVKCGPLDLSSEPPAQLHGAYDLAYCFEVGQRLSEEQALRLVEFTAEQAPIVIFSSAQPDQGGPGAINKQPKSYWIERFERAGVEHSPELSARVAEGFANEDLPGTWLIENVIVFGRDVSLSAESAG